jgi:hypothetical protein
MLKGYGKEVFVACFAELSQHLTGESAENHNPSSLQAET